MTLPGRLNPLAAHSSPVALQGGAQFPTVTQVTGHPFPWQLRRKAHFPVTDHSTVAQVAACPQYHPSDIPFLRSHLLLSWLPLPVAARTVHTVRPVLTLSQPLPRLPIPTACPPPAPRQPHLRISLCRTGPSVRGTLPFVLIVGQIPGVWS